VISRVNGFSLDVRGASDKPLTLIQTAGFGQQHNREWTFTPISQNVYAMKASCGAFADIRGAGGEGSRLQLGDGDQAPGNRHFIVGRSKDGYYTLTAEHSGFTLDVVDAGGWMSEVQTAGVAGTNQQNREWLIVPASKLNKNNLFLHDNRIYLKIPMQQLKTQLQTAIGNQLTIESLSVGDVAGHPARGGLNCQVRNKDGEGLFVLQPRSWGTPNVTIKVDVVSTRAFDLIAETLKAFINFDERLRQTLIPSLEAQVAEQMQKFTLPNGMKVEVIGLRTDGLVLVSNRLDDKMVQAIQAFLPVGK
jgi:hypothetical protein